MTFQPPLEIPADLLAWMQKQSHSEFVGSMLRLYQRNGGVSQSQLDMLRAQQARGDQKKATAPKRNPLFTDYP